MERTLLSVSSVRCFPFPTSGTSYSSCLAYHFPSSLCSSWLPWHPQLSPSFASTDISIKRSRTRTRSRSRTRTRSRSRINNHFSCRCCRSSSDENLESSEESSFDCFGTGLDVQCLVTSSSETECKGDAALASISNDITKTETVGGRASPKSILEITIETGLLVSPFFFWGSAMVAMKEVIPMAGPFFVAAFRLLPSGLLLVAFAASNGRPLPSGLLAWLSISLFAFVDAACFQGFLAQGLQRTPAGLGSVIIDSQPLTVALLANLLFGESIEFVGVLGLLLGLMGLLLLEVPSFSFDGNNFSLWGSGEWWMLLAAQSMAVGTVMIRWISKYSDPVMATGWHMVIGGLPLVVISILNSDPAFNGGLKELTVSNIMALLYTSIFGSAISYGLYFYSATKGSLTKLSSLTFLTPMFASIFGYIYLGETFSTWQLVGAIIIVISIYMVNYQGSIK